MEHLYVLLVVLLIARAFGVLAVRLRQPPLVGELMAGIILGAVAQHFSGSLPVLAELPENEVFLAITDLGIFFLMLLGGIEMRPRDIAKASGAALVVASSAMLLPLAAGFGMGWVFLPASEYRLAQAAFIGTALAITAVPVAIRVLQDLGWLDSKPGRLIVSAAVFDDVMSLILLAVLSALIRGGELPAPADIVWLVSKIVLFFIIVVLVGWYILPLARPFVKRMQLDELEFSLLLLFALAFAVLAELLGMHFILGSFAAGVFFGRRTVNRETYDDVKKKVAGITSGFLAPIFFASIGFHLNLDAVTTVPGFLFLLIVLAVVTKLAGAGVPALWLGFSRRDALAIGTAMTARGAVELIIADIALRAGLFEYPDPPPTIVDQLFSSIVLVAIITTIAVPFALGAILPQREEEDEHEPAA